MKSKKEPMPLGDYVADVIKKVFPNVKECRACKKRKEWLNKQFPNKSK